MRVLHVMAGAQEGGAETMMLDGAVALAEAGVAQHVLTRPDSASRLAQLADAGVPVSQASFDKLWRPPTRSRLQQAIAAFRPCVIHYWMGRAGTFAPSRWRERNLAWYGGYYKLSRFRNCAWHAGVTSDIARHIAAQGAPLEQVSVLPTYANIIPAPPVSRASLGTPEDAPVILALARLHWKKGLDTLIDALSGLPQAYCWIAGAGPLREELEARARGHGLEGRVRFLGWRDDRSALLAACDIVAFPSRYEPFGTVTVEAWAAGKPLVVADAAGPAATVTNEENALLVPKDDPVALRTALRRLMEDADLARRVVDNGRRAYEARFTKTAFVRNAMALYEKIKKHAENVAQTR
jgi:glycosyltransferase involved in cell wall biosynthesis